MSRSPSPLDTSRTSSEARLANLSRQPCELRAKLTDVQAPHFSAHKIHKAPIVTTHHRRLFDSKMSLTNYLHIRPWTSDFNFDLVNAARNHKPFISRFANLRSLPVHDGCVNTICWNQTGEYLLSGSDDCNLCITKPGDLFATEPNYSILHRVPTNHLGNIFCARFMPNTADRRIVSCSSQGPIFVHDLGSSDASQAIMTFNCHSDTIWKVVPLPDNDKVFLSCSEDKTLRLFDLRVHRSCARAGTCPHPALIRNSHAMTTLQVHPFNSNLMLVGRADASGLVYDRRKLPDVTKFTRERAHADRLAGISGPSYHYRHPLEGVVSQFSVPKMDKMFRFTSLSYNRNGCEVLASFSGDYIYLFDHDRSSNFELIQTLPTKTASSNEGDTNNQNGDRHGVPAAVSRNGIRLRGDWSVTGVNSVPMLARSANRSSDSDRRDSSRGRSILEQVAASLVSRRRLDGNRNMPAGMVGEPTQQNAARVVRDVNRHYQEQPIAEQEDVDDEEEDDNSTLIDEEERDDDNDDHDHDDEDGEENFERYADMTVRNLVNEANEQAQRLMGNNESRMMDLDEDSEQSSEPRQTDVSSRARVARGISSSTRAKFKKTIDDLKNKYNSIPAYKPKFKYQGHRNSRTSIKEAIFWGDNYMMSGSDCGRIMVWEKETAKLVMAFKGDERVVNCLAPNPSTYLLASSGIDYDIKLWSTQGLEKGPLVVDEAEMRRIVENNELMLEESRHTLSVPTNLFFRVLASLMQSSR